MFKRSTFKAAELWKKLTDTQRTGQHSMRHPGRRIALVLITREIDRQTTPSQTSSANTMAHLQAVSIFVLYCGA